MNTAKFVLTNTKDRLIELVLTLFKSLGVVLGAHIVGVLAVLSALLLPSCATLVRPNYSQQLIELRAGEYTLDPAHAYVNFKVGHLGLSTIVGRFNDVTASLDFNPDVIAEMTLQGVIKAKSIDLNDKDLESRLHGGSWFDVDTYPSIRFTSSAVVLGTNDELIITGDITIRDVTKELVLNAKFNGGADNILTGKYTLGFSATTQLKRSDFGMDSFAALVADDVQVELHGEFQRN